MKIVLASLLLFVSFLAAENITCDKYVADLVVKDVNLSIDKYQKMKRDGCKKGALILRKTLEKKYLS